MQTVIPKKIDFEFLQISDTTSKSTDSIIYNCARTSQKLLVATPNLHFYALASRDAELVGLLKEFHLMLPDGWPISLSLSIRVGRWKRRLAGSDLFLRLLFDEKFREFSIKIVGGKKSQNEKLHKFMLDHPNVDVYAPDDSLSLDAEKEAITKFIKRGKKRKILVICLGFPLQEKLAVILSQDLNLPILCLGASLDFVLGIQKRAPKIFQLMGLEWLWRLIMSPKRLWKRYILDDLPALLQLLKALLT